MLKKFFKNEKGFTLVEILVVIVIIGILFAIVLPKVGGFNLKAQETTLRNDFRIFQTSIENYVTDTSGNGMSVAGLNDNLDKALQVVDKTGDIETTTYTLKDKADPWGAKYQVRIRNLASNTGQITIEAVGKNPERKYLYTTYYRNGEVDSCTLGLAKSEDLTTLKDYVAKCGDDISATAL